MPQKVLLVGWDAADWKVITPLLDAGRMPNLARLVEGGVMGTMATLHPIYSPMLWTSIATGVRPFTHGVLGFSEPTPDGQGIMPISNRSRKVRAIWNILHLQGLTSNVVGWWPSHPAEPIRGVMVSNHFQHAFGPPDQAWPLADGSVHPAELRDTLGALRFNPNELGISHLVPFIPQAAEIDQQKDRRLSSCMKILAEAITIQAASTWLMANTPWDFMAVYFDCIDHFSHAFMRYHPPQQASVTDADFALYKNVIDQAYVFHDLMLGEQLRLAGEETTVLLLSDHGFHSDHLRPAIIPKEPAGPALEHRDFGIFAMKGPGIRRDELVHGACVLDITPTLLTLFGLPIGADMDGRPLVQAFAQPPALEYIPSWEVVPGEDGRLPDEVRMDSLTSKAALDQLVALGYIQKLGENREQAVNRTLRELRYNLAQSYRDADRNAEALAILRELHQAEPDEFRFELQHAWTCLALGRLDEMREVLDDLGGRRRQSAELARAHLGEWRDEVKRRHAARKAEAAAASLASPAPEAPAAPVRKRVPLLSKEERAKVGILRRLSVYYPHSVDLLMGQWQLAKGDYAGAFESLRKAEPDAVRRPGLHIQIGEAYLGLKQWQDAETAFQAALDVDPDNPHAHLGLSRSLLARRQVRKAATSALAAIQRQYNYPMAHYCLGRALMRMNAPKRAREAFQVALAINPNFADAHRQLARLYEIKLNDPVRAAEHRRQAEEIVAQRVDEAPAAEAAGASAGESVAEPIHQDLAQIHLRVLTGEGTIPWDGWTPAEASGTARMTVVAGLPRSGTSLLMQMLHAGGMPVVTDQHRPADVDNPRGYFEFAPAKNLHQDQSWVEGSLGKAVKIVAQLLPHLPRSSSYRVLLVQRPLNEVMASQKVMLDRIEQGGGPRSPEQLRRDFSRQLAAVTRWLRKQANIDTLLLHYADIVADPLSASRAINRFLGGGLDEGAMAAVVDQSLHRQRHAEMAAAPAAV